ncbi:MAG: hypothetical protein DWI57_00545 [Chloroflexi bacterium]|nr:MAG: hypothetical protein DWI57_00545 [Chloroflexota bacterium]
MFWKEIFALNHIIILSIYGQVFFVLGLAIFLQSRRHSRLKLARDLRWLALFGILHGMHEWGQVFIPIQTDYLPAFAVTLLLMAQIFLLAASFAALLIFGYVLVDQPAPALHWLVTGLPAGWLLLALTIHLVGLDNPARVHVLTTAARYFLALPGSLLAARGLYRYSYLIADAHYGRMLRWAAWSLVAYALVAGLIVAPAPFFPANLLHRELLLDWLGVPVEVFRSLVGLVLTISIIRALDLFETEVDRLIEKMEIDGVRASERDRIGQEIHDGVMQGTYSVGLILDSMANHIDNPLASQRLLQAQQVLEQVILGLRRYMTSLRSHPPTGTLDEELMALIGEARFRSLLDISLEIDPAASVEKRSIGHIIGLVQEALSNVVRHAGASQAKVRLALAGDTTRLTIEDNGQGFVIHRVAEGYGLLTMRNHAQLLGGQLTIDSAPDRGTIVCVAWPQAERRHMKSLPTEAEARNG